MTETTTTLKNAIDRSRSHNEIINIEWDGGDAADLLAELGSLYDGEIDDVREDDDYIDVWGYQTDAPEGEMDWRLRVTITKECCPECGHPVDGSSGSGHCDHPSHKAE